MEKVIFTQSTLDYFDQLVYILFEKEYFSYEKTAQDYVYKIVQFIENSVHFLPHKIVPLKLSHHGSFYIFYKPNQRTTWYVFFEKGNQRIVVTSILNNHCKEARYLSETS
ncbi:MAG: hypothetical protein H0X63_03130 [Flavobacteriales bacterium]|nr:hypothetical protein [Flavobacteriales bacterium]